MQAAELMDALLDLAAEAGIEVRSVAGGFPGDGEGAPGSGICRVQERVFVVLSGSDPVDIQLDVLGQALREHAAVLVEGRFLPPAVRARLLEPVPPAPKEPI